MPHFPLLCPNVCRKVGQEIMFVKSNRETGDTMKSPEVTCLGSINRTMARTVVGAQPDYSHATTIKTLNVHPWSCPYSAGFRAACE